MQGTLSLQWRHNEHDGVSNHWRFHCLLNRLFRPRSKKTSKLRVAGLCEGLTGQFPAQKASSAENISIWWRHKSPQKGNILVHVVGPSFTNVHHAPTTHIPTKLCFSEPQSVHNTKWDVNSKNIGTHYWFTALFWRYPKSSNSKLSHGQNFALAIMTL